MRERFGASREVCVQDGWPCWPLDVPLSCTGSGTGGGGRGASRVHRGLPVQVHLCKGMLADLQCGLGGCLPDGCPCGGWLMGVAVSGPKLRRFGRTSPDLAPAPRASSGELGAQKKLGTRQGHPWGSKPLDLRPAPGRCDRVHHKTDLRCALSSLVCCVFWGSTWCG